MRKRSGARGAGGKEKFQANKKPKTLSTNSCGGVCSLRLSERTSTEVQGGKVSSVFPQQPPVCRRTECRHKY